MTLAGPLVLLVALVNGVASVLSSTIAGLVGRVLNGTPRVEPRVNGVSATVTLDLIVAAFVVVILGLFFSSIPSRHLGSSHPNRQI